MYNNWLKVCKLNKSLKEKIMKLTKENEVMKRVVTNYEFLATEQEGKVQEIMAELENTQKNLKLLNSRIEKLDHLLNIE